MTIPPIAVESAKEAAHRLLELCMSDAPPLDKDLVRSHALDVIEALTDDEEHQPIPYVLASGAPPVLSVCPECQQTKHGNCDGTSWDALADAEIPCSCTHPGFNQPEWSPEQIDRLRTALTGEVAP